jgi:hypothetical protein
MSDRFAPPSAEELKARGLNADGTPIRKEEPKKATTKKSSKKKED